MAGPWEKYQTGGSPMAIPLPVSPRQQQQDARQAALDERNARNEAARIQLARNADARAAAAAVKGEGDGNGVGRAMTMNKRGEMQDSLTSLNQFESDLNASEQSFRDNFENQGMSTLREYLPGWASPTNQDYNATSDRMLPLVAKALGFTSKQMDTPSEIARLKAYVPQNDDADVTARNKLAALRNMLDNQRGNIATQLGIPSTPEREIANARSRLEQQLAGLPAAARQIGMRQFDNDPRTRRPSTAGAPRRSTMTPEQQAALKKYGL